MIDKILERLVSAREQAGLSQGQAGKLLDGLSTGGLCDIEKGRNTLTLERFLKMCEIYGVNPVWALTGTNPDFDPQPIIEAAERARMAEDELLRVLDTLQSVSGRM